MRKFKTKRKNINYRIILFFIAFLIIFVLLSTIKLSKSNSKLTKYLLKDFDNSSISINIFTSKLDKLLNTYYFK